MKKKPRDKCLRNVAVFFSLMIFVILIITLMITALLSYLLIHLGITQEGAMWLPFVAAGLVSSAVGTLMSRYGGRRPLKHIVEISNATKEVAKGNYDVTIDENIYISELQETAHNFNIMTKELASVEMLRSDFVENVSHEFKTPLAAIEGYTTLLQRPNLTDEKRAEYTEKILYNTKRLSSLTGNILLLSQLENQEREIQRESFCLDEQIREVILYLEDSWTKKNLELDIDLDAAEISGNRDLLYHVWFNLLNNAIKFAPQDGQMRAILRRRQDSVYVSIVDNGVGMSDEVSKRIFEKFYQGDKSHSSQGNGLGLTLAKRIVDLHGGEIEVSSKESKGTTFTVTLPLSKTLQ